MTTTATYLPSRIGIELRRRLHALPFSEQLRSMVSSLRYLAQGDIRRRNQSYHRLADGDASTLPSPKLVYLVARHFDLERFDEGGKLGASCIRETLARHGLEISGFSAVLDFGCGCGRILRHWRGIPGVRFCGTDYNPRLVRWCQRALPFAEVRANQVGARLSYGDQEFDFVYALSVFTHLTEELQQFWINELGRILRPGGYLYITVHGASYLDHLTDQEQAAFNAEQLVVVGGRFAGKNSCAALHPEAYVRRLVGETFTVVDFIPLGARDSKQDVFLLKRLGH